MLPIITGNNVLVVPLDWGLGHATRCIPVINHLLASNKTVLIGGCGSSGALLQRVFPGLPFIEFPPYNPTYHKNMYWSMLKQAPRFFRTIKKENNFLKDCLKKNKIDTVISDNRYGLYNASVETVFITHQLFIKAGVFSAIAKKINHRYIKKFNQCWIPDYEDIHRSLSGELSHGKHGLKNIVYIGPLSRFTSPAHCTQPVYTACALVSGPEPLRTTFENELLERFTKENGTFVLLRGKPEEGVTEKQIKNIRILSHLDDAGILELIRSSRQIIGRSGYSTIMDLHALKRLGDAQLVPTPGQTEQVYLARWMQKRTM